MKPCPKISITILNYNGKDVLKSCLFAVLAIDYPNFEVIVVDNNSIDGSFEEAKNFFPGALFIKNEKNIGYAGGNNVGIRQALKRGSDYVLLLNYDTIVSSGFLKKMTLRMEEDKKIGIASPVVLLGDSNKIWFSGGRLNWFLMKAIHDTGEKKERVADCSFISGCCMLIKREVFEKAGLLDEEFFLYWEDVDFSLRAKKAGFRCAVFSDCQIRHYEKSEEKKPEKAYYLVLSGLIFFKKHAWGPIWLWISFYVFLRRLKNKIDLDLKKEKEIARAVRRAYCDFDKLK